MPDGQTHIKLWKQYRWTSVVACGVILTYMLLMVRPFNPVWVLSPFAIVAGYLLGFFIDPDLDQANITSAEWRMMRHLKIFGTFLVMWFQPYGWLMTHRSFLSHFPVVSTFIRLMWLAVPFIPLIYFKPVLLDWFINYLYIWLGVFLGMSLADTIHFLADEGVIRA